MTENTQQDPLSRELLAGGRLSSLTADRHVVGITINPTIFAAALSKGNRYDQQLRDLAGQGADTETAVFAVTTDDVRRACDILTPVYERTAGRDGCVSIEVVPGRKLARSGARTGEFAAGRRFGPCLSGDAEDRAHVGAVCG